MQKEETPLKKGVSLNFFIVYLSILAKFGMRRFCGRNVSERILQISAQENSPENSVRIISIIFRFIVVKNAEFRSGS